MTGMGRVRWYVHRLRAMSVPEIAHRGREAVRKRTGKHWARRTWRPAAPDKVLPALPGLLAGLRAWDVPENVLQEWREHADQADVGTMFLLGQRWPERPLAERWHLDPVTGGAWPSRAYCHDIDYRHQASLGDVKFVWELGRLQYLQPVAALAFKRHDGDLARLCVRHVESWIDANPFATGIAWASGIELALRVVSLLVVSTLTAEHFSAVQVRKLWETLEAHGLWLERFPSLFSSANNHRVAEGLGLFMLGALCPSLPRAAAWADQGWAILCEAAEQQIHADGVGVEQSIAYTGVVLEMLLLGMVVARACGHTVPERYVARVTAAATWLRWFTDEAGNLPRIGDDDNARVIGCYRMDETHTNAVLAAAAALLQQRDLTPPGWRPHLRQAIFGFPPPPAPGPSGMRVFAAGGYSVMRRRVAGRSLMIGFDHGALGYLSIAAHGHADALAVWLHVDGQPVLADSGTFLYHAGGPWRRHFRGTAAHNTLRLEDAEASIQSGHFNWSHKARARLIAAAALGEGGCIEAEHDGYRQRFGVVHRRRVALSQHDGTVSLRDSLDARRPCRAEVNFLLFPGLRAALDGDGILVHGSDAQPLVRLRGTGPLLASIVGPEVPGGWYSPSFNVKQPTTLLCWQGMLAPDQIQETRIEVVAVNAGADLAASGRVRRLTPALGDV